MELMIRSAEMMRRSFTRFKRRHSRLRRLVPLDIAQKVASIGSVAAQLRPYYVDIRERSRYDNVYHCCIPKTGSQWLRSLFSDIRAFQYSGLLHCGYSGKDGRAMAARSLTDRRYAEPFPVKRIVGPLYVTYDNFRLIPQPRLYRALFVMRDPRDAVVSWYFSARHNHLVYRNRATPLHEARRQLVGMSQADGLAWSVRYHAEKGRFAALDSWSHATYDDNIMLVRFEDLAARDSLSAFERVFSFLDIRMPTATMRDLLDAYSFRRLSGRDRAEEDTKSHLRGGTAGNWRRYFTPDIERLFYEHTGDLVARLGYE